MSFAKLAGLRASLPVGAPAAPAAPAAPKAPLGAAPARPSPAPRGGLPLPPGWAVTFTAEPASAPWLPDRGRATLRDAAGEDVFFVDLPADTLRDIVAGRGYPDRAARDLARPAWWLWLMGAAPRPHRPAEGHWVVPVPLAERHEWVEAISAVAPAIAAEARAAAAAREEDRRVAALVRFEPMRAALANALRSIERVAMGFDQAFEAGRQVGLGRDVGLVPAEGRAMLISISSFAEVAEVAPGDLIPDVLSCPEWAAAEEAHLIAWRDELLARYGDEVELHLVKTPGTSSGGPSRRDFDTRADWRAHEEPSRQALKGTLKRDTAFWLYRESSSWRARAAFALGVAEGMAARSP